MTVDQHELYVTRSGSHAPAQGRLRALLVALSPADYLVFLYLSGLCVAAAQIPAGDDRTTHLTRMLLLVVAQVSTVIAIRGGWLTHPYLAPLAYRIAVYGTVQSTYFLFASFLPLANPRVLDHGLYDLDLRLFGVEPAAFLDRFVDPATTEWFAFFYFSYFLVLGMHVIPLVLLSRHNRAVAEFTLGLVILFGVGHTLYMLVPGYGPYKAMPELFAHALPRGLWWNVTTALVAASGAQKDIFPSLHTAAPTFMLLYSFHRRGESPFKYTWPIVALFAANIVIATMFLRWHYVVDVLAGLLLATAAHRISVWSTDREIARRAALDLGPVWPLWPARR